MPGYRPTPNNHVVDRCCPAEQHGYYRAHTRGCICPGDSYDHYSKLRLAGRNDGRKSRALGKEIDHVTAPPFWSPPIPEPEDLGRETRAVLNSDDAACTNEDPEAFFPVGSSGFAHAQIAYAKSICQGCPIQQACLRQALDWAAQGVWGGTTELERERMRANPVSPLQGVA